MKQLIAMVAAAAVVIVFLIAARVVWSAIYDTDAEDVLASHECHRIVSLYEGRRAYYEEAFPGRSPTEAHLLTFTRHSLMADEVARDPHTEHDFSRDALAAAVAHCSEDGQDVP